MRRILELADKKTLGEITACKLAEAISIIAVSIFAVGFINSPSPKMLVALTATLSARFVILNLCARKFLKLSMLIQTSLRKQLHAEIFRHEIPSGELLTLIFDTIQTADEFFIKVAPNVISVITLLPIFLIAALIEDWITAAILLVTLPIAPLLLYLIGKATAERNARAWTELQRLNGAFRELLSAITTLKMFGRIESATAKLKSTSEKSSAATLEVLKFAFISSFALELITTLSIALVAVTLGLRLVAGSIEFESALFLLLIAPEFFTPIRKLGIAFHIIISAKSALERVNKYLNSVNERGSTIGKLRIPVDISVDNVSFTYPNKKSPALVNVNLNIPAGKITAITGESGCGKSTLLKLLAGLNLPTSGEILFSDIPISTMLRESLLSKVAYTPQSPHLFDATLAENFSMLGQLDTSNLQELLTALNLNLNLHAVQKLSRGQLQRLGLIRALLKDSPLILLDEPTAGLDSSSEALVLSLIKQFSSRRTIVIATHRQAVINFADSVINIQPPV